ncbi:FAD-dependent monooxygenase [Streptacidiphilus griseoplanus]|uniref:FAD-dependent monooxygenase n=1 Tax=Peterkaempfera griseoplana TaxID=66896 RepID=UPI0006E4028B|nr:FAD-dependent monooxygenase [Peterkaempfera griseoplana]
MPHRTSTANTTDVLVVGAGPTGLLLAGDLAAAGVRVTVLERRGQESNLTRAFAVHARTLEELDARGIADELIATGTALSSLRLLGRLRLDLSGLRTRFPFVLITPQFRTEEVLQRRAEAAGAVLLRGTEVVALRQDAEGVELDVRDGDGATVTHRARYAVGADGVRSTVRRLVGLPFPGESVVSSVMLADVRLERAPEDLLGVGATGDGFGFVAPFGDGWYRVIAWDRHRQLPDDAPVDPEELRSVLRRTLGDDYGMHDPRWTSRFHSDERQVPRYRVGRVLLAGDAAHCHSPAGGQGMNTGLQDAANLGWKLAAEIHGHAPDGLLDTYHAERHPVGAMVLRGSGALIRVALARTPATRLLRSVLSRIALLGPLARRGARLVSGIGIGYPAPRGAHPLTGRRVPDLRLDGRADGPGRLYEALRTGAFVLVGRSPQVAAGWGDRVVAAVPAGDLTTTVLVRPDGYAAWAAERPTTEEVRAALGAWLGEPGKH